MRVVSAPITVGAWTVTCENVTGRHWASPKKGRASFRLLEKGRASPKSDRASRPPKTA